MYGVYFVIIYCIYTYIVWYYNIIFNVYFIYLYYIYIHIPVYFNVLYIITFSLFNIYIYIYTIHYYYIDKNPHPDAKLAFDALQESYESISTSTQRSQYNTLIIKNNKKKYAKLWNLKKNYKSISDLVSNYKSLFLLFHYEITHINDKKVNILQSINLLWNKIYTSIITIIKNIHNKISLKLQHFKLLPTTMDRFLLLKEIMWNNKKIVLVFLTIILSIMIRK